MKVSDVNALLEMNQVQHANLYDCFPLYEGTYQPMVNGVRLFGNANVGNMFLTNVQVAGTLAHADSMVLVRNWYARTSVPLDDPEVRRAFEQFAHATVLTFTEGYRQRWTRSLAELFRMAPGSLGEDRPWWSPWPVLIPPRQDVGVRVDHFRGVPYDSLLAALIRFNNDQGVMAVPPPLVWIHFDGLAFNYRDTKLDVGAIVDFLLAANVRRTTMEEQIAAFLLRDIGHVDETTEAMLHALADGIREGRHRGEHPHPDGDQANAETLKRATNDRASKRRSDVDSSYDNPEE